LSVHFCTETTVNTWVAVLKLELPNKNEGVTFGKNFVLTGFVGPSFPLSSGQLPPIFTPSTILQYVKGLYLMR